MKTYITLAALICLTCLSEAFATGISETTNGFYLVIDAAHHVSSWPIITNEPIRFDDRLVWMPFCETGEVELTYAIPQYCVKVKMTDVNGKEVPKTALGKKFGSQWDSMGNIYSSSMQTIRDAHPYPFMAGGSFKDNPGLGGARFLLKPNELFEIEKPGIYTLEIQMQMFYPNAQSANAWHRGLFQFSPIKIKVEKPKEQ